MTFAEIVSQVQSRLNLSSTESATRIGVEVNDRYRRITSSIGINLSRRATFQANASIGVTTLTFLTCEKLINVVDRSATPYRVLDEVTVEYLRSNQPSSNATPRKYAIVLVDAHAVTIEMDCVPQTAFTLYADGYNRASTLSGSQEPAFEEDFHDILYHGALADEYRKMEKAGLGREAELMYEARLSDLRMFRAKSSYLDIMQNGNSKRQPLPTGGSGGSGSSTNGATSYTQTGLITFDRSSAGAGSAPFAVVSGAGKVTNLDADKLDGLDSTAFVLASDATVAHIDQLETVSAIWTFSAKPNINAGLQFPATQVSSSNVNTLDDYEEGTFTPILQFGGGTTGITYTTQTGFYTKIGDLVHIEIRIVLSSKGSSTGTATIVGLPFATSNLPVLAVDAVTGFSGLTGAVCSAPAFSTTIFPVQSSATGRSVLTDTSFTGTTEIRISGTYITAT